MMEVEEGLPLVGGGGAIFRDQILRRFTQETPGFSYRLTYLIRSILPEDTSKRFTKREYDACWTHLMTDLGLHRPRLIVAFGTSVFQYLRGKAINKREIDTLLDGSTSMNSLRKHVFSLKLLEDYEPDLLVCYSPSFVLSNPSATRYIEEDSQRVVATAKRKYSAVVTSARVSSIEIKRIDLLDTEEKALNFLTALAQGELTSGTPVAFDTETMNLNRRFNNAFLSWQFSFVRGEAVVIPIEHPDKPLFEPVESKIRLVEAGRQLFNASSKKSRISMFVAHNAKFDLSVLYGLLGIIQKILTHLFGGVLKTRCIGWMKTAKGLRVSWSLGTNPTVSKTLGKELFNFRYRAEHLEKGPMVI
jgi:uracil-DNA glycosylase family 4